MTQTPTAVDHGITITCNRHEDGVSFSWPWRASCLCGWQSSAESTRPRAVADGQAHIAVGSVAMRDANRSVDLAQHPLCTTTDGFTGVTQDRRWEIAYYAGPAVLNVPDGDFLVEIGQEELRRADDKSARHFLPAVVAVWGPDDRVHIPVEHAHSMAAAIVAAAEKINGEDSRTDLVDRNNYVPKALALWQTVPCPPWCEIKHQDNDHPDDRDHGGEIRSIAMRAYPTVEMTDGQRAMPRWNVYLRAPLSARQPTVRMFTDDLTVVGSCLEVELDLEEAAQLAAALRDTIAEANAR